MAWHVQNIYAKEPLFGVHAAYEGALQERSAIARDSSTYHPTPAEIIS